MDDKTDEWVPTPLERVAISVPGGLGRWLYIIASHYETEINRDPSDRNPKYDVDEVESYICMLAAAMTSDEEELFAAELSILRALFEQRRTGAVPIKGIAQNG